MTKILHLQITTIQSPSTVIEKLFNLAYERGLTNTLNLPQIYNILNFNVDEFIVTLKKNEKGQLGFRIDFSGNILDVKSGGPADEEGQIETGDTLIQINGKAVSLNDGIIDLIRKIDGKITLTFKRPIR